MSGFSAARAAMSALVQPTAIRPSPMSATLPPPLRQLAKIIIDPQWPLLRFSTAWSSPLGRELPFTFFETESGIQENAGVNYADTEIVGRAEAYKSYISTGNKEVPLTFHFHAQGLDGGMDVRKVLDAEVVQPAKWLDALKYPAIINGVSHAPPPCLLMLGELLTLRVVATEVSVQWMEPFDPDTLLPHYAVVTCVFTGVHRRITGYRFNSPSRFKG
jgi:hypothetical protein